MYVDAFVMPVQRAREQDYLDWAKKAAAIWMEYGALSYAEARADDVPHGKVTSFPRAVQLAEDEVLYFSWATYRDKAQRDAVMEKVMTDPRLAASMEDSPANMERMIFGGFAVKVGG